MSTTGKDELLMVVEAKASSERLIWAKSRWRLIKLDIAGSMNTIRFGPKRYYPLSIPLGLHQTEG